MFGKVEFLLRSLLSLLEAADIVPGPSVSMTAICDDGCCICAANISVFTSSAARQAESFGTEMDDGDDDRVTSPQFTKFNRSEDVNLFMYHNRYQIILLLQFRLNQLLLTRQTIHVSLESFKDNVIRQPMIDSLLEIASKSQQLLLRSSPDNDTSLSIGDSKINNITMMAELLEEVLFLREAELDSTVKGVVWKEIRRLRPRIEELCIAKFSADVQMYVAECLLHFIVSRRLSSCLVTLEKESSNFAASLLHSFHSAKQFFVLESPTKGSAIDKAVNPSAAGMLSWSNSRFVTVRSSTLHLQLFTLLQDPSALESMMCGGIYRQFDPNLVFLMCWIINPSTGRLFFESQKSNSESPDEEYNLAFSMLTSAFDSYIRLFGTNSVLAANSIVRRGHASQLFGR